jgi:hypothetical protein
MQIEAEELAKRVANEPDNRARIRKAYQLVYARDPSEAELKLGLDYLHAEPLKEYEENKNKPVAPGGGAGGGRKRGGGGGGGATPAADAAPSGVVSKNTGSAPENAPAPMNNAAMSAAAKSEAPVETAAVTAETPGALPETPIAPDAAGGGAANANPAAADDNAGMGTAMMDGVPGMGGRRGNRPGAPAEVKYDPTAWGRYAKILFGSTEFLFIN